MDLNRLNDFFRPDEIEFRIGATNSNKTKGIALAYVTNRAIQNRLDEVCGKENWKNEYKQWGDGAQICGISILINGEWITKWDGAENPKTEPVKGGLSNSMKRAAVQWGIGRYLYDIPNRWFDIVPYGKNSYKFKYTPTLPDEFLPKGVKNEGYIADVATPEDEIINDLLSDENSLITESQLQLLTEIVIVNHLNTDKIKKYFKINKLEDMTQRQFNDYIDLLQTQMTGFKMPKVKKSLNVDKEQKELDEINSLFGGGKK